MWWWTLAFGAECNQDTAPLIEVLVEEVEEAFDQVDDERFERAYLQLGDAADCIRSELSPAAILAWHRGRALGEYFQHEIVASQKSWAAVRVLAPDYRPPDAWMPAGSELFDVFEKAPMSATRQSFSRTPAGGWKVDGQPSSAVPTDRGFVLQGFDQSGQLVHSAYHYSIAEVPVVDFLRLDRTARQRRVRRMRVGGTLVAGGLMVGAVSAWGLAAQARSKALDPNGEASLASGFAEQAGRRSNTAVGLGAGSLFVGALTWGVRW